MATSKSNEIVLGWSAGLSDDDGDLEESQVLSIDEDLLSSDGDRFGEVDAVENFDDSTFPLDFGEESKILSETFGVRNEDNQSREIGKETVDDPTVRGAATSSVTPLPAGPSCGVDKLSTENQLAEEKKVLEQRCKILEAQVERLVALLGTERKEHEEEKQSLEQQNERLKSMLNKARGLYRKLHSRHPSASGSLAAYKPKQKAAQVDPPKVAVSMVEEKGSSQGTGAGEKDTTREAEAVGMMGGDAISSFFNTSVSTFSSMWGGAPVDTATSVPPEKTPRATLASPSQPQPPPGMELKRTDPVSMIEHDGRIHEEYDEDAYDDEWEEWSLLAGKVLDDASAAVTPAWNWSLAKMKGAFVSESITLTDETITVIRSLQDMVDRRYEKTDESHALMLKALWHAVRPDEKYVGPVADEWEDVGFQKSDPSTDFRGMGLLGLHCLIYIGTCYHERSQVMMKKHNARTEGTFPWACAGINICAMMYEIVQLGKRDFSTVVPNTSFKSFITLMNENTKAFEELFCIGFFILAKRWEEVDGKYMDFPVVLDYTRTSMQQILSRSPSTLSECIALAGI